MNDSKFNPEKPFCVEVHETAANGKPRTFGVKDLTFQQAKEYFNRMEPDSKFQFFRMQPDGTMEPINMEGYEMQFGIWKRGYIDGNGNYHGGALMEICDSEAEANEKLKNYKPLVHYIEPY